MNSPLHITILIEAVCHGDGYRPNPEAEAQVGHAQEMEACGLVEWDQSDRCYRATSRGKAHLDALCEVPLPEWRTPWEKKAKGAA